MKTYLHYKLFLSFIINPIFKKYALEGLNPSNTYILTELCNMNPFALLYIKKINFGIKNLLFCMLFITNNLSDSLSFYKLIKKEPDFSDKILYIGFLKIIYNWAITKFICKGYLTYNDCKCVILYCIALYYLKL